MTPCKSTVPKQPREWCYASQNPRITFGIGNAKLAKSIATFSLPAGHTCPFAKECKSQSNMLTGKIVDGEHCKFRCFAATGEARATTVRKQRWGNFNILTDAKSEGKMGEVIQHSLPHGMDKVRVHVSGDFFNERYFVAWLNVALNNPVRTFYGYTKATPFLVKYAKYIPANFRFTASLGGTHDHLVYEHDMRRAEVVYSVEEAESKGLEIDHDDSLAINPAVHRFALLLHGTQPPGSAASRAWVKIQNDGIGGYGRGDYRKTFKLAPHVVYISVNGGKVTLKPKTEMQSTFSTGEVAHA